MIPLLSRETWVIASCFITWLILCIGSYQSLEKILLAMVFFFSVVTLIIVISMQSTTYAITSEQIMGGLSFSFPLEHAALALAVFGFTGISYGEIMAYTYWCLEKGYANHGDDKEEKKAWIKVMQTDVWATVFFVTLGTRTISDYLIAMGLVLEKEGTRNFLIQIIGFAIPLFSCVAYFLLPDPITLLLIAGIWAALGLPIINIGALYLTSRLSKELQPKPITKLILWLTLILQILMAISILFSQMIGFS